MIKTFKNADTQNLFEGKRIRRWVNIESVALRKLAMLNRTACLDDLRIPPGNRLERLKGDRADYYSIRINDQFRICFRFEQGEVFDVEIVDYH
jgi:proteic killer suppression protein